jgi:hypothetical protein
LAAYVEEEEEVLCEEKLKKMPIKGRHGAKVIMIEHCDKSR